MNAIVMGIDVLSIFLREEIPPLSTGNLSRQLLVVSPSVSALRDVDIPRG
ncbi:MAG: hypothetical protein U0V48_19170 [Anaerolineales bacterium]